MEFSLLNQQLFKQQQNGEYTDCSFIFKVETDDGKWSEKIIHGHKAVFVAVSEYFEKQFKAEWQCEDPIPITSVQLPVFEKLVRGIYLSNFSLENLEEAVDLYEAAHFYQIEIILDLIRVKVPKLCCTKKIKAVSLIFNMAWKYQDATLIGFSTKYFIANADMIIEDEDFMKFSPEIINILYQIDDLSADELSLIEALEKYVLNNSHISINILKPAIGSLRFLSLSPCIFKRTILLTHIEKASLSSQIPQLSIHLSKRSNHRSSRGFLWQLPSMMQDYLRDKFSNDFCWLCQKTHDEYPCSNLKKRYAIYQKYDLDIDIYNLGKSEIIAILQGFEKLAKSDSDFSQFANVTDELNNLYYIGDD